MDNHLEEGIETLNFEILNISNQISDEKEIEVIPEELEVKYPDLDQLTPDSSETNPHNLANFSNLEISQISQVDKDLTTTSKETQAFPVSYITGLRQDGLIILYDILQALEIPEEKFHLRAIQELRRIPNSIHMSQFQFNMLENAIALIVDIHTKNIELRSEIVTTLVHLSLGTPQHLNILVKLNAFPLILGSLDSTQTQSREKIIDSVISLGKIEKNREQLLNSKSLKDIIEFISSKDPIEIKDYLAILILSAECTQKDIEKLLPTIPILKKGLLSMPNEDILSLCINALNSIIQKSDKRADLIVDSEILGKIFDLLQNSENAEIVNGCITLIKNAATSCASAKLMLDFGLLNLLNSLFIKEKFTDEILPIISILSGKSIEVLNSNSEI